MKLSGLSFVACSFLFIIPLLAAPVDTCAQEKIDLDERKKSVVALEKHISQRTERIDLLAADIRTLDRRVEAGVTEIVKVLSEVADSEDSRVRVAKLKGDVVGRLRKSVDLYVRYRNQLKEDLRSETTVVPRETLESDLAIFNERIETRVKQVKTIAESFTKSQDLEKYVVTDTESWGWRTNEIEEISEAWKQDRRDSKQTESMREQLIKGLQESIDHLTKRNSYLEGKLKAKGISATEQALYKSDLERNRALIEVRKEQVYSVNSSDATETRKLSQNDAHETELLVEDMITDLKEDFFAIFRKYSELNKARAELKRLSDNLAARKQWLADYEKANP